ncbi:hypothetical protein C8J56DRAFT_1063656 [Mycena floridula]|nr:hypothetical protein C8J56DRAFT_1063656 [Mycena floridula]
MPKKKSAEEMGMSEEKLAALRERKARNSAARKERMVRDGTYKAKVQTPQARKKRDDRVAKRQCHSSAGPSTGSSTSATGAFLSPEPHPMLDDAPDLSFFANSAPGEPEPVLLDLLTPVVGKQTHIQSSTQDWTIDDQQFTTVLPFILDEVTGQNILSKDADAVKRMAEHCMDKPGSKIVILQHHEIRGEELLAQVSALTAHGKTVVLHGCPVENMEFTLADLKEQLQIRDIQSVQAHDAAKRIFSEERPHVDTDIKEFVEGADDPSVCRTVLELHAVHKSLPLELQALDEGISAWNMTATAWPPQRKVPADVFQTRMWVLLHHAGIFTYPHRDANGYLTVIIPRVGVKLWAPMWLKWDQVIQDLNLSKRKAYIATMHQMLYHQEDAENNLLPINYDELADYFVLVAQKGDIVFQPANQWHMVYTPEKAITVGGHFLTYASMHLTEISRWFDSKHPGTTNHNHSGIETTLIRMMLALPQLLRSPTQVLHRRSLIAFCRMLIHPNQYRDPKGATAKYHWDEESKVAREMATLVLKDLGFSEIEQTTLKELHDVPWGDAYDDPGPPVTLTRDLLQKYITQT